ncbi:MAG: transposase family protein [Thauera sp.]|nr:transposase family protein [Thauera sp.]
MATRRELVNALSARYRTGTLRERSAILDEFVAITGYHRKHAIRLLAKPASEPQKRRPCARYGEEVRAALNVLWEVSDRVCSKRLKVMIPVLLPALIRHGRLDGSTALAVQLNAVSPATIDRLLAPMRLMAAKGRQRAAGHSSAIRRAVPIRTFGDWNDPAPGYVEVDFVAHCGPQLSGSFIQTLVLTDIATGWTECLPVLTRDGTLVIDAIAKARELFPFPLHGVDFDNDSVFMNERVVTWCREQGLEVTRARAYRKNDQAWVEQKNGAIVRRLVGYGRFEGLEALQTLSRLFRAARLHTNLLQPSFKLRSKTRIGARVVKQYHSPAPPAQRVLADGSVSMEVKATLRRLLAAADPVLLFDEIRAAQAELGRRMDRRGIEAGAGDAEPVPNDALSLNARNAGGEQRAIHRRPYKRRKPLPRRPRMLDAFELQVFGWLMAEPGITAVEVLKRLEAVAPAGMFATKHLRTVQRALEVWRADVIRQRISECGLDHEARTALEDGGA